MNRNLLFFSSVFLFLSLTLFYATQKILPVNLTHTVYYCRVLLSTLSLNVPHFLSLFLAGLLLLFLFLVFVKFILVFSKIARLRKQLAITAAVPERIKKLLYRLEINGKTHIIKSDKQFAYCFGLLNPGIYLSEAIISKLTLKEIEAILLHERHHLINRDPMTMLIASVTQSLFPFFPILSDILRNYRIERELYADREAVLKLGSSKPLLTVLNKLLLIENQSLTVAPAIADFDTLESRIKALTKHNFYVKSFNKINILISFLSATALFFIITTPIHATEYHAQGEDIMVVCTNDRKCITSCTRQINASYPFTPSH